MAKLASLFQISIWLLARQASCGSIAAWWNTRGPSFIMQDDDTGGIRYSLCNGNYTPILPDDKTLEVPFYNYMPKRNTSLAASGWTDSETAWASIFYLNNNDVIINKLLKCDWNTGHWKHAGEYAISADSPKASPTSALSVVLLGSMDGYRVYYNDLEGSLHQIGYTSATSWAYYGLVSNDKTSAQAIGSTFSKKNITVVRPRDDSNIGVSRLFSDNLWHISTFPEPLAGSNATNATQAANLTLASGAANFSLPAWDGGASALAVSIDDAYTRSVFYVGTDRNVHQVGNKGYAWSAFEQADAAAWPRADVAGAPIGIANAFGADVLRLYYVSGGRVVEANGDGGTWVAASAVPSYNESQASSTSSSSSSSTSSSGSTDSSNGGLSDGAKVGVSVGVTLGVIAVAGMGVALWFLRYRQRKLDEKKASAKAGEDPALGPGGAYVGPPDKTVSSHDGYAHAPQGYPSQNANAYGQQVQGAYAQQPAAGGYAGAAGAEGYGYPQQVHQGIGQDGAWAYGAPAGDYNAQQQQQQQQYYYQHQQQPQELAETERPVELMGEGHYKEVP